MNQNINHEFRLFVDKKLEIQRQAPVAFSVGWYRNIYLKSLEWHGRRLEIYKDQDWICGHCGQKQAAHVHHYRYTKVGNEDKSDLVAVCPECHAWLQRHEGAKDPLKHFVPKVYVCGGSDSKLRLVEDMGPMIQIIDSNKIDFIQGIIECDFVVAHFTSLSDHKTASEVAFASRLGKVIFVVLAKIGRMVGEEKPSMEEAYTYILGLPGIIYHGEVARYARELFGEFVDRWKVSEVKRRGSIKYLEEQANEYNGPSKHTKKGDKFLETYGRKECSI